MDPQTMADLDAAKRVSDRHNLALLCGHEGKWMAFHLSDGESDTTAYDTRDEAIAHQLHETQSMYVCVQPVPMPHAEALQLLGVTRRAYDAGFRITDVEAPR
jgi:hypothetical protein